jgi:hypothetical protein
VCVAGGIFVGGSVDVTKPAAAVGVFSVLMFMPQPEDNNRNNRK